MECLVVGAGRTKCVADRGWGLRVADVAKKMWLVKVVRKRIGKEEKIFWNVRLYFMRCATTMVVSDGWQVT